MRTYELVAMSIAAGAVLVPLVTVAVLWLVRRDRIFAGVAPGEVPADVADAPDKRVGPGTEYWGELPLRSEPPTGISPGLAGVVLDGAADGRDIAAMVLDLTRRGWLSLAEAGVAHTPRDWQITRVDKALDATLDLNEVYLITNIAAPGGTTRMSELRAKGDHRLGLVQLDLAREVVARGWYPAPPSQPSDVPMAVVGLGGLLGIVVALMSVSPVSLTAGAVIVACAYLTSLIVRGNTPRTALGTAVRIQVLGFRRYLEDAQSYQFSYTDAAETFRAFLPWAVVFGLEQRWAQVFAELDVVADTAELHLAADLRWFAGIKGPENAVTPTPERREADAVPRRLALEAETPDPAAPAGPATLEGAPPIIEAAPRAQETSAWVEAPVERFVAPAARQGLANRARSAVVAATDLVTRVARVALGTLRRTPVNEPTLRIPPQSPATPLRPDAGRPVASEPGPEPELEEAAAVRQWVPRPSARPAPLTPRARGAVPAQVPVTAPSAPATPRRAPRADEAPAAPESPQTATGTSLPTPVTTPRAPRGQLPPWSDWLDELDQAMSGDVEADGPDATDGGTVISGPERFDVLLAMPLWPDVPVDARHDRRAG